MSDTLTRTALYDIHVDSGARMVPFAGFAMPIQFTSILREHEAVRRRAGLFDLSHMAQIELCGEAAAAWADRLTVNKVASMKPGAARYNILTNSAGGAHDDVIFYRLADRLLVVANAANAQKIARHFDAHNVAGDVGIINLHGSRALLAVQGPRSLAILSAHVDDDLGSMPYYSCRSMRILGQQVLVARTGYTGEDGFELFVDADAAATIYRRLLVDGHNEGLEPVGLGARDMLRLEAGMPLYGHELSEEISPYQAGLDWVVKLDKPDFIGRDALALRRVNDRRCIAGLRLSGRTPAREGYRVFAQGVIVGEIRSASFAPSVENAQIATALIDRDLAVAGRRVDIEIRGAMHEATVTARPFYLRPAT